MVSINNTVASLSSLEHARKAPPAGTTPARDRAEDNCSFDREMNGFAHGRPDISRNDGIVRLPPVWQDPHVGSEGEETDAVVGADGEPVPTATTVGTLPAEDIEGPSGVPEDAHTDTDNLPAIDAGFTLTMPPVDSILPLPIEAIGTDGIYVDGGQVIGGTHGS